MHLNQKQIFLFIIPIVLFTTLSFFADDLISYVKNLFPNYKEYQNKSFNQKATIYLKIESKDKFYQEIQHNIKQRLHYAPSITDAILYKKTPQEIKPKTIDKKIKKYKRKHYYKHLQLEAVFPKQNVAIINGIFLHTYQKYKNITLLKVLENKVLLQTPKGKRWLTLFH
jgi:predicted RND superfamily exporter protein